MGLGGDDVYEVDGGDTVTEALNAGTDLVKSSVTYTLPVNVEHLVLKGSAANGTGNPLGNHIDGNDANNLLSGLDGDDNLVGWGGNDTVLGGTGDDQLVSGEGNDSLDGGSGADQLTGNEGDDTYLMDNLGDVVTEADTVAAWRATGSVGEVVTRMARSWRSRTVALASSPTTLARTVVVLVVRSVVRASPHKKWRIEWQKRL